MARSLYVKLWYRSRAIGCFKTQQSHWLRRFAESERSDRTNLLSQWHCWLLERTNKARAACLPVWERAEDNDVITLSFQTLKSQIWGRLVLSGISGFKFEAWNLRARDVADFREWGKTVAPEPQVKCPFFTAVYTSNLRFEGSVTAIPWNRRHRALWDFRLRIWTLKCLRERVGLKFETLMSENSVWWRHYPLLSLTEVGKMLAPNWSFLKPSNFIGLEDLFYPIYRIQQIPLANEIAGFWNNQ